MSAPALSTDPRRRSLLAKVHLAAKELGLAGDSYRDALFGATGKESAGDCSEAELIAVLDRFKALGWRPAQPGAARRGAPRTADHKVAAKARALWISLYHLGAISDPGEPALEAFARRQLGCERLQWANQRLGYRLIEALKAMAERHGWDQSTEGVVVAAVPVILRRRLIAAIIAKMRAIDLIPAHWSVEHAAWRLSGIQIDLMTADTGQLDALAKALGDKLREGVRRLGQTKGDY